MKVNVFAMPTIPATLEERERLRPVGRSTERYQMMLQELRDLVKAADALGIDAFGTTEHHFHTEGGEACPNPLLMYSHLAGITERIAFIPMSIVLPAGDPIRIAEDVALFDQMYPGRVGVCFARGYQKRWIQVVTQRAKLTSWEDEDADRVNREVFDEYLEVVLKAWTEETFDYDGKHYQVPYPHSGIEGWAAPEWTRRYGADGEIDENGVIRRIGVIPPPYTKPHPPVFRPFAATPKTLYQAAAAGHVAVTQEGRAEQFGHWCAEYQRVAQEAGRDVRLGEGMGAVRAIAIGDSYDEAFDIAVRTAGYEWHNYFNAFGGSTEVFRTPEDDPDRIVTFTDEVACTQRMIDLGYCVVGTPEQCIEQLEPAYRCNADGELEWLVWNFFAQGILPREQALRQLELFTTKVLPAFKQVRSPTG